MTQYPDIPDNRKELKEKHKLLKEEYVKQLTDKEMLLDFGKSQLEALYVIKIGKKQLELLEIRMEVKGLKKRVELAVAYVNRNETIDWDTIELIVNQLLSDDLSKIMTEAIRIEKANYLLSNLHSPERSAELRKLYRKLAKELHPDVNQNLTEQQNNLWHAVRKAYESGDLDSMRALSVMVNDSSFDSEKSDILTDDDLKTQIDLLKAGIEKILSEIEKIRLSFPFNIQKELHDEEWVAEQNRKTELQIEEAQSQKKKYEERIELLKSI
jgi:hypothetical protein